MNFDLMDIAKPCGEKLMGHIVWISSQTVRNQFGGFIEQTAAGSRSMAS